MYIYISGQADVHTCLWYVVEQLLQAGDGMHSAISDINKTRYESRATVHMLIHLVKVEYTNSFKLLKLKQSNNIYIYSMSPQNKGYPYEKCTNFLTNQYISYLLSLFPAEFNDPSVPGSIPNNTHSFHNI